MVSETLIDGLLCADWFLEGSKWEIFFGSCYILLGANYVYASWLFPFSGFSFSF